MRHWLSLKKEKLIVKFWHLMPNSFIYWAVIEAWARATTQKYTSKTPSEVTWDMALDNLTRKK